MEEKNALRSPLVSIVIGPHGAKPMKLSLIAL